MSVLSGPVTPQPRTACPCCSIWIRGIRSFAFVTSAAFHSRNVLCQRYGQQRCRLAPQHKRMAKYFARDFPLRLVELSFDMPPLVEAIHGQNILKMPRASINA